MGTVVSFISQNTGRTDDPDPVTGLTTRDKYLVKTSWAKLAKTPTDSGVALLLLFFKKFPQYVELFPFKDTPYDELKTSKKFRAHCTSVVYGLSAIIDAINDNDLLIQLLHKTGSSHKLRSVTQQGFEDLKAVTIELFSSIMKPDEVAAWKKTLEVAFSQIYVGIKEN
ncbi:globin-like isoform X2 [Cylas formicarius]|nr:globin-like isoform X2 [Cylas formicarius]XP_060522784.1 globin-like isoform X2 [Cylas formicarius]XP_060522785.1 globin-like isoform X2 [Cylas formicarius]XP_060522786.1 globin-like isoform X2 [Cylas formicarius]